MATLQLTRRESGLRVSVDLAEIVAVTENRDGGSYVVLRNREGYAVRESYERNVGMWGRFQEGGSDATD